MDPLSVTASIIAVVQASTAVISYCIKFSSQMKGAEQEILQVISELKTLRDLLEKVSEVLPEDDRPENAKVSGLYLALQTTWAIVSDISGRLYPLLQGGFKSKLKWPFKGEAIKEKLEKLQNQKSTLQLGAPNQYLELYKTSDPEQNHKTSRERHEPETCSWVFKLDSFKSWISGDGESLWIHGIPGAGKTIICSTIIEHVRTLRAPPKVVYYYFDFSDTRKQLLSGFFQSVIYQLIVATPEIPEVAANLYEEYRGLQQPGCDEYLEVFMAIAAKKGVFVIIDAIDECSKAERSDFFRIFVDNLESKVNLLITSRREPDIEKALSGRFTHSVSIEGHTVDEDVRRHVSNAMATDPTFQKWASAAVKIEVLDRIVAGCHGMFRWAVCQLEVMKNCSNLRAIRVELGRMPKTLDQTYDRILQGIPEMHRTFVESALRWLVFSERPLLLDELGEAAVIDPEFGPFNADDSRFLDPKKILELCGSLVVLGEKKYTRELHFSNDWLFFKLRNQHYTQYDQGNFPDHSYITVSLSHYSVKEYLTSERLQKGPLSGYFMAQGLSHRFLTQCAILYLQGLSHGHEVEGFEIGEKEFHEYPLLEYCAVNWMKHFRKGDIDPDCIDLLMEFFDDSKPGAYMNWLLSYEPDIDCGTYPPGVYHPRRFPGNLGSFPTPLYWAAWLGSVDIAIRLIDNGADVEGSDRGFLGSPLSVASYYRFEDLVRQLIERGADPNGKGGYMGTVLQSAAVGGSHEVVKLLVKAGADFNKIGGQWNTALVAAARHGHDKIVSYLLELEPPPDITLQSSALSYALYQAALAGDIKITNRLLNAGADINEVGPDGTALYAACSNGSIKLVQMLLRRGADVNKAGGKGGGNCPLIAAAGAGDAELVRVLLRAGADVNAQPTFNAREKGASALEAAIRSKSLETFETILNAGGDPNLQGDYPNGLYAALHIEQLEMAKILLDRFTEISDGTFLRAISLWNQDPWFLRTILERNLNVNIDAHSDRLLAFAGSALHFAIDTCDEEAVRLILEKGPYIDALSSYGSVFTYAISKGMTNIANELIEKGADTSREMPIFTPKPVTTHPLHGHFL
ncbi:hypothetical protein TWF481_004402 [Arthrobotrys musiformis]|uniref:Nephrocystin 3-like N-terminal domain-containing protein n=1 Tax=Arthrobotrys musiformis TaxID=47236 RepID=A0AAV9WKE1_9PEZI